MTRVNQEGTTRTLIRWWRRLQGVPGGAWLFNRWLGWFVPYSGSIGAEVMHFEPGHARVGLDDRRRVRNHLRSVHAVALLNLGELATGLALLSTLPGDWRGIVRHLEAEYVKKARGRLIAESRFELPPLTGDEAEYTAETQISDGDGETVAIVRATWLLGRRPQ